MADVPSNIVAVSNVSPDSDLSFNAVNDGAQDLEIEKASSETQVDSQQLEGVPPLRREKKKCGGAGAQSRRKLKRKLEAIAAGRLPSGPWGPGKKMMVLPELNDEGPALPS